MKTLLSATCFLLAYLTVHAQDFDSKLNDAKFAMMEGNFELGLSECRSLIESGEGDSLQLSMAYGYAGISSEALGKKTEAIGYYYKAVQLQIPQLDVYDKLISLSRKESNDSVYESSLLEKSKAFPEYYKDITSDLAYHYFDTKQYEKLLEKTNELLSWHPDNLHYLFFKGIAFQNLDRTAEAKSIYNEILGMNPEHSGANMSLGMYLFEEGNRIFVLEKKEYEAIANPDRVDYHNYNKGIEEGKILFRKGLPYLLKAYEDETYSGLKPILFRMYILLEEKEKAEKYR